MDLQTMRHNLFTIADEQLKQVFSKYPYPETMDACPHCCIDVDQVKRGEFGSYIMKAMTTWGSDEDFKYYLPQLLSFVYLEGNLYVADFLTWKLDYVEKWELEEMSSIRNWMFTYVQYKRITGFEKIVEESRQRVLERPIESQDMNNLTNPFSVFLDGRFKEAIKPILSEDQIHELENALLRKWPENNLDTIVFTCCVDEWFIDDLKQVFDTDKIDRWLVENKKKVEDYFFESTDVQIQKCCSDVLKILKENLL